MIGDYEIKHARDIRYNDLKRIVTQFFGKSDLQHFLNTNSPEYISRLLGEYGSRTDFYWLQEYEHGNIFVLKFNNPHPALTYTENAYVVTSSNHPFFNRRLEWLIQSLRPTTVPLARHRTVKTVKEVNEPIVEKESKKDKQECTNKINFVFIHKIEGFKLDGYVPNPRGSNSGVTVASGFDIGARSKQDLINLGLESKLVEKLSPYCGKKKFDAVNTLKEKPLTILEKEALEINKKVKKSSISFIEKLYNRDSSTKFFCLPAQAQTTIASVSFQYGDLSQKTPTFWKYVTNKQWSKAIEELNDFGDDYPTRRKKEAEYLKGAL